MRAVTFLVVPSEKAKAKADDAESDTVAEAA